MDALGRETGLMGSRKVEGNNWGSFGSFMISGKTRVTGQESGPARVASSDWELACYVTMIL